MVPAASAHPNVTTNALVTETATWEYVSATRDGQLMIAPDRSALEGVGMGAANVLERSVLASVMMDGPVHHATSRLVRATVQVMASAPLESAFVPQGTQAMIVSILDAPKIVLLMAVVSITPASATQTTLASIVH